MRPLSADGAGSTVALADIGGQRRIAFAADEDDARIHAFDVDRRVEIGATALDGAPGQVVVAKDGSVFVALKDRARVARYRVADEEGTLVLDNEIPTAAEPIALALGDGGRTLLVASGWGAELAVFDISTPAAKLRTRVALAREPRAVIATANGGAVVAHASAEPLSVVSFDGNADARVDRVDRIIHRPHPAAQGYALAMVDGKVFAPQVEAEPEPPEPQTYYGGPTMTPVIATVGESSRLAVNTLLRATRPHALVGSKSVRTLEPCLLPRAAAVRHAPTPKVLVACMGNDQLIEYDTRTTIAQKWSLGGGVTGLAVEPATDTVIAWAQHTRQLVIAKLVPTKVDGIATDGMNATFVLASGASRLSEEVRLGRTIFHSAGDRRLSADGRACASCHPDGRDDGRVWRTPDGPRQTMMLAGRLADTAPYGWTRQADSLQAYAADTMKRLRGAGLSAEEGAALEKYLLWLRAPNAPGASSSSLSVMRVAEGKAIFESREAGCSRCHAGAATTDGLRHDVGTGSSTWVDPFETPSLRFVGKTAPYFHDGRYASLRALLVAKDTKMGSTKHLRASEIDALAAYLETL